MSKLLYSDTCSKSENKSSDVKFFSNTAKKPEKEKSITTIIDSLEKMNFKKPTSKVFGILPGKTKEEEFLYESDEDIGEEDISIKKPLSTAVIYNEMTNKEELLLYEDDDSSGSDTDI